MLKFLEHRIADKRILRLIRKWLKAGVIEDGRRVASERGCPQGAVISPLLSNIYLHYVLDTWAHHWRKQYSRETSLSSVTRTIACWDFSTKAWQNDSWLQCTND
jgi:retron-type reverse transcriptase